jgi:two-component system, OmpR family, aerobic respiration control sensor histidine kinase ArcB
MPTSTAHPPALPDKFDLARFLRLIDLAGPSLAPVLLPQLVEDLNTCHRRLIAALPGSDWDGLRQASHDLIALAGSCGAETLHDLARTVNTSAHDRKLVPITAQLPRIEAELAALVSVIRDAQTGRRQW